MNMIYAALAFAVCTQPVLLAAGAGKVVSAKGVKQKGSDQPKQVGGSKSTSAERFGFTDTGEIVVGSVDYTAPLNKRFAATLLSSVEQENLQYVIALARAVEAVNTGTEIDGVAVSSDIAVAFNLADSLVAMSSRNNEAYNQQLAMISNVVDIVVTCLAIGVDNKVLVSKLLAKGLVDETLAADVDLQLRALRATAKVMASDEFRMDVLFKIADDYEGALKKATYLSSEFKEDVYEAQKVSHELVQRYAAQALRGDVKIVSAAIAKMVLRGVVHADLTSVITYIGAQIAESQAPEKNKEYARQVIQLAQQFIAVYVRELGLVKDAIAKRDASALYK